jgi:hypothetical protein
MDEKLKFPTEQIELPSKGLPYSPDSPLSKGVIEMKYMSAKEEDILTNVNFLKQGIVIDKLLQSLIVTPINYSDLLIGDKNALLVAARILGYGKNYDFEFTDPQTNIKQNITVDLSLLDPKPLHESIKAGKNEFDLTLPTGILVTFKLLTHGDEKKIDKEIEGLKRINPNGSYDVTTRLKHMITSVNGSREQEDIRNFSDNMLVRDSRFLRDHYRQIEPDINLKFNYTNSVGDVVEGVNLPIGINFLWPDSKS